MRYGVFHLGVPLGSVELPEERLWAGGMLEPESAYDGVGHSLREATALAGRESIAALLQLPAGEVPPIRSLAAAAADALRRVAPLDFELRDPSGRRVAADVVRLIDLADGSPPRVAAHFRAATAGTPAWLPDSERRGSDHGDAGV